MSGDHVSCGVLYEYDGHDFVCSLPLWHRGDHDGDGPLVNHLCRLPVEVVNDARAMVEELSRVERWPKHSRGWMTLEALQSAIDAFHREPRPPTQGDEHGGTT